MPGSRWRVGMTIRIIASLLLLVCAGLMLWRANILGGQAGTVPSTSPAAQSRQLTHNELLPPNNQALHDLAIAAVDFDPESGPQRIFSGRPYNLLVAVENKGSHLEGPFTVSLQLLAKDTGQLLMTAQRTLRMLSAGDVTVVHFPGQTPPQAQGIYLLSAQVQTLPRDADTTNNKRVLEVRMNRSN
jgi:hypothetical protein